MHSVTRLLFVIIHIFLAFHGPARAVGDDTRTANLGAIIDANSRIGKEVKTAMEIAIQSFNNSNHHYKLALHVHDSGRDPLEAVSAAEELIDKQQVQAILGMETWHEAALVAEIGNRAQVPIFSFATTSSAASLTTKKWPFLVRMTNNERAQMKCVAAIVGMYKWRNAIAIYEDDTYGSNSGMIMLLSDALRDVGTNVEYRMAFAPISLLSDPKDAIREELGKLNSKQSRVFILVEPSVSFAAHLFIEARRIGLMGRDSAWITTDSIASVLHSFNSTIISSMQGVLGIKTYFSEDTTSFREFHVKFRQNFRSKYPEEDNSEPGIHAVHAYDAIFTIASSMEELTDNSTSKVLLDSILSSNFSGLSGKYQFKDGELSNSPVFQIFNVTGKSYKELYFRTPEFDFSGNHGDAKPMKVGVPYSTFIKFVNVEGSGNPNDPTPFTGFCIDVFREAVKIVNQKYAISYEFEAFIQGSYEDLIDKVYYKEFDAVVGDVTILPNRSDYVEFTQPFVESGVSLIVPAMKKESLTWMLIKPFTAATWLVTAVVLLYTMLVIWLIEHRSNPDFRGPWKDQLGIALWFTFSTLFFAHRERPHSNFTRIVMVVWLFVVLVLNSSYTASLTSTLTVQQLESTQSQIEYLKRDNSKVGCYSRTWMKYFVDVLGFKPGNILNVSKEEIGDEFERGNIKAAVMEHPYEKEFLLENCKKYTTTKPTFIFGGWGFVFPLGSGLAAEFSKAILELLENGNMIKLEDKWFGGNAECAKSGNEVDNGSLGLDSFWGLFVLTVGISTIVFLLFLVDLCRKYRLYKRLSRGNMSPSNGRLQIQMVKLMVKLPEGATASI